MLKALLRRAEGLCLPDVDTAGPIKDSCLSAGGWRVSRGSLETVSQFDFGLNGRKCYFSALKNVCLFNLYSGAWIQRNAHCNFKKASMLNVINRIVCYS